MPSLKSLLVGLLFCSTAIAYSQNDHSIARQWNEVLLEGIRHDQARPTVHARNLFHSSIVMFDAIAVYDVNAEPFLLGATWGGHTIPFYGVVPPSSQEESIELSEVAINYAM